MVSGATLMPVHQAPGEAAAADAQPRRVPTFVLIVLWYGSASLAVVTSKLSLMWLRAPALLSLNQSVTAAALSWALGRADGVPSPSLQGQALRMALGVGSVYTAGFLLTNVSLMAGNASFTETVKASEPVASVVLAAVMLSEFPTLGTLFSIGVLMAGTAMSCVGEGTAFSALGLVTALAANVCFALRSVLVKKLKAIKARTPDEDVDPVQLFLMVSCVGIAVNATAYALADEPGVLSVGRVEEHPWAVRCMLLNGLCYAVYNLCSFMVLQRMSVVRHAVFNVFRRVWIIAATMLCFRVQLSATGFLGAALSFAGFFMYVRQKSGKDLGN